MRVLEAVRHHITSIRRNIFSKGMKDNRARNQVKILIDNMLERVHRAKEEHGMSRWAHMDPTTPEFGSYSHICATYEAYGYICLGHLLENNEKNKNMEIGYYEKARDIFNSAGVEEQSKQMTDAINRARANYEGGDVVALESTRRYYYQKLKTEGENSEETIMAGLLYASSLHCSFFAIEAERFAARLAAISHQIFGPEYRCTKMSVGVLTKCRKRFITTLYAESFNDAPQVRQLQALRYVNNDEDCIVIRDEDDEGEPFSLPRSVFFPTLGCPVICHGLVNASHLNGKL